ncbi:cell envelope integrity protein TolA [Thiogranum longum]
MLRERPRPFIYALLVHVALLAVLVFSLDWQSAIKPSTARKKAPVQAVVVDAAKLDSEIQRQKQIEDKKQREAQEQLKRLEEQAAEAQRKRKQEEQRLAELQRKKQEEAKRQAETERKRKAELAAKKKAEAERKRQEEEKRKAEAEAERKRQEEEKRKAEAERKRQEEEKRKAEAERKLKAEEEARRKAAEQEMQARLAAEQERLATQRRSAMQRMIDEYVVYIQEKVQRSWIRPPSSGSELSCTVEVRLIPSGEVIDATIVRGSGNPAFDRSVEAAVFKASPLPVPPDPEVMEQFRSLRFEFKPGAA